MNSHPRRTVAAVAVGVIVLLAGCSHATPKVVDTSPIPHLAAALAQVKTSGATMAKVYVTAGFAMVVDQRDGEFEHSTIYPDAYAPRTTDTTYATAPWSLFDPDEITEQVTQLSKRCKQGFEVEVRAVTSHAVLSTVDCYAFGDTTGVMTDPDALLNGKKMRAFDGLWSPLDWQDAVTEWQTIAGSIPATHISISNQLVRLGMTPEAVGGCTPSFRRSLDGWSTAGATCSDYLPETPTQTFSLDTLTGEALSRTASKIMAAHNLVPTIGTTYYLDPDKDGVKLLISQGGVSGSAIVT